MSRPIVRRRHALLLRERDGSVPDQSASCRSSAAPGVAAAAARSPRGRRRRPGSCGRPTRSARTPLRRAVQLVHHQLADQPRRHLALAERAQLVADVRHRGIDRLARHRALLERLEHAVRSFDSSNGSRLASLLTTRGMTSSADSKVVKRSPQSRHSRRRRTCWPSPARRESITLVSPVAAEGAVHVRESRRVAGIPSADGNRRQTADAPRSRTASSPTSRRARRRSSARARTSLSLKPARR